MISNGKSRCQGLAFFAPVAAGMAVDWLGLVHLFAPGPKLFSIISSMPVRRIPNSLAAGCGSRRVSAVITSTTSGENPGPETRWRMASANESNPFGIERTRTSWPSSASGSLHQFPLRQRNGTNQVQSAITRHRRLGGSNGSPRQVVHIERLLKIAAAADQLGFAPARISLQRRRAFGCGPQQKRSAQYRIAQAGGTHQSFCLSLAAIVAVGRFLIGSRGADQNELLHRAPLRGFHDATSWRNVRLFICRTRPLDQNSRQVNDRRSPSKRRVQTARNRRRRSWTTLLPSPSSGRISSAARSERTAATSSLGATPASDRTSQYGLAGSAIGAGDDDSHAFSQFQSGPLKCSLTIQHAK